MSERDDQLRSLQEQLDALKRIKTAEDFDEGARLHAEKNAPWINGPYSHLRFEPYVFTEYPKALYRPDFQAARQAVEDARMLRGVTDNERREAIVAAEADLAKECCLVSDASEERLRKGQGWYLTIQDALDARKAAEDEIAVQAAHLAYEDRHLGELARREREAADAASEGHLVEVPIKRGPGRPKRETEVSA